MAPPPGQTGPIIGTHTYAEEGTYAGTVTWWDDCPSPHSNTFTVTVTDAALTNATATSVSATAGTSFTAQVASFADSDPGGTASDYSATINWGDGSSSPGTVAATGSGFAVNGTHTYASPGSYKISVTIADAGGSSTAADGVATVSAVPPTVVPPTVTTVPLPVLGKAFDVRLIKGSVFIKLPGGKTFIPLTAAQEIPAGTIIDARHGTVELTAASARKGKFFIGDFSGAVFKLSQVNSGRNKGLTILSLLQGAVPGTPSFASCKRKATDAAGPSAQAASFRLSTLRSRARGRFRTRGRYGAATIHGTVWDTTDFCNGTGVKVHQGTVTVTDFVRHKTVRVHAGHSYLARKR
jgi:PKD repeat protein